MNRDHLWFVILAALLLGAMLLTARCGRESRQGYGVQETLQPAQAATLRAP